MENCKVIVGIDVSVDLTINIGGADNDNGRIANDITE